MDHQDGYLGASFPEAEALAQLRLDAGQKRLGALDALDAVRRDAAVDEYPVRRRHPLVGGAEKLAVQEPGVQAPDDQALDGLRWVVPDGAEQAAAPYKPDAGQSAEQSFAAPASAGVREER
jgi:hypothetical protein